MAFRYGRYGKFRVGDVDITIDCGEIIDSREKSVGCRRGDRKIFLPRSYLKNPNAKVGDIAGKVKMPFALARKFGLLSV